jgi:hypothetical protein
MTRFATALGPPTVGRTAFDAAVVRNDRPLGART